MNTENHIETSILRMCINDKSYFYKVKNILEPQIFENPANAEVFKIIKSYNDTYNRLPTLRDVIIECSNIQNKEFKTSVQESLSWINQAQDNNVDFMLDQTLKYAKDQIYTQGLMIGSDYFNSKNPELIIKSKELIEKSQKLSYDDDLGFNFKNIDERLDYYKNPEKGILYKRFATFNKFLGEGFLPGTLNLFLAPTGVGKSLLMSTSIVDFLIQGKNILLISLEMNEKQFFKRIDVDFLDLTYKDILENPSGSIRTKFHESINGCGQLYLKCYGPGTFSASDLETLLEMYKSNGIEFDLVFLDYLGIMKSDRVGLNVGLYSYGKAIAEEVRAVAVKYNKIIFSANQLNKTATNDINADNSSVSDSGAISMTADFMCFLLQNEEMKQQGKLTFKITKNRYSGLTNSFSMNVDYSKMRVLDEVIVDSAEEAKKVEKITKELLTNTIIAEKLANEQLNKQIQEKNDSFWGSDTF